jgi:hypothetical protein
MASVEPALEVQEGILRVASGKTLWRQAAEIVGISLLGGRLVDQLSVVDTLNKQSNFPRISSQSHQVHC